jgi:hypothetical protein
MQTALKMNHTERHYAHSRNMYIVPSDFNLNSEQQYIQLRTLQISTKLVRHR